MRFLSLVGIILVVLVAVYWFKLESKFNSGGQVVSVDNKQLVLNPTKNRVTSDNDLASLGKNRTSAMPDNQDKAPNSNSRAAVSVSDVSVVEQTNVIAVLSKVELEQKSALVHQSIPANYHDIFQSSQSIDIELVTQYSEILEQQQQTPSNNELEQQITAWLYAQPRATDVQIEYIQRKPISNAVA